MLQAAWHGNLPRLPIFGDGSNVVPTIHVLDLGAIVLNLTDSRPKTRYILAVDDSHCSLAELVRTVSKNLGNGLTQRVAKEEALLNREVSVSAGRRVSVSSYHSPCTHSNWSLTNS